MNKTVTAGIGGIHFHLEEAAFEKFKNYLDSIRRSLAATEGRDEILQDIEARVAEMLQDQLRNQRDVVSVKDVETVMAAMGRPEDFGAENGETTDSSIPVSRKLFRDPEDKVLGGVCSGMAAYLNIDAVWIRLLFAVLFFGFGTGFMLYLILWMVIPKALSTADRLRMRGEPVNLSTIERNIREELEQVRQRSQKMADAGRKHSESVLRRMINGVVDLAGYLLKAAAKILAFFFLVVGLIVSLSLFALLLAAVFHVPGVELPFAVRSFFSQGTWLIWAALGVAFTVGIPFLAMAWAGAKILFNVRVPRVLGFFALGLWLIGLFFTAWLGIRASRQFNEEGSFRTESVITADPTQTLVLSTDPKPAEDEYGEGSGDEWDFNLTAGKWSRKDVRIDIVRSPDSLFHLVRLTYARGPDVTVAAQTASRIDYGYRTLDSVLMLDRTLTVPQDEPFRNQRVQLVVQMPVGSRVFIDPSLKKQLYDISNLQNIFDADMVGRTWRMTQEGLSCVDCSGNEATVGGAGNAAGSGKEFIRLDSNGVSIQGKKGEVVLIDSNGMQIRVN